jgi:hypothetical protein
MADPFGIPQITSYLSRMGLKIALVDSEREVVELAFHGNHGQWRMIVGFQQHDETRKLMLIAPHLGTLTTLRRLECLEALMFVNYRIAVGKFGIDLEDGEVRLEEAVPLGLHTISFEQFQLVFGALLQTVAMYSSLLPRIMYSNLSAVEALKICEQEFLEQSTENTMQKTKPLTELSQESDQMGIDLNAVMAEVERIFEKEKE